VAWAEAYFQIKWHPNPSNRLATTYQHHSQTDRTETVLQHRANHFANGRPKIKSVAREEAKCGDDVAGLLAWVNPSR